MFGVKMKKIMLVLIVLISFGRTVPPDNNERINKGASTSKELTEAEKCEIENYAEDAARLLVAEDIRGSNLTDMMNNRFHELEAFHDQIYSYSVLAEYGPQALIDMFRRMKRLRFYNTQVINSIKRIIIKACNEHFNYNLRYEYNNQTNMIIGREDISLSSSSHNCLCDTNYRERMILSEPFFPPAFQQPEITFQIFDSNTEVSVMEVSQYHIIPLSLISKFFEVWLIDELEDMPETNINGCVLTLISRLRRSIQKLFIVQVKNTELFSNNELYRIGLNILSNENYHFFEDLLRRASSWLSGNIFLGPQNRGPFNPHYNLNEHDSFRAFEFDVEPIIGRLQYEFLLLLFQDLQEFINGALEMNPLDRLLGGLDVFNSMAFMFVRFDITPMNSEQWIERLPTEEELGNVQSEHVRRILRTQTFWAIKKPNSRHPRSLTYYKYDIVHDLDNKVPSAMVELKYQWSKFIKDLFKMSVESHIQGESLIWSCNLTRLFTNYLVRKSNTINTNYLTCESFDRYLYSKISKSKDWFQCNEDKNLLAEVEWCSAWRRYNLSNFKAKPDSKDVKILIDWLTLAIKLKECKNWEYNSVKLKKYTFHRTTKSGSVIDTTLCFLSSFGSLVFTLKSDCQKIFA